MAEFLAYRIMIGKCEYSQVPVRLQADVKRVLTEMGYEDLAK